MKKLGLIGIALASLLNAQIFNISTTAELRTALENSATNGEDDTIILADGTYKTTDDGQGTFKFLDNEAYKLTLKGSSADNVILSGDNQHQIFNHNSTKNAPLIIEKLSFVDGNNSEEDGDGGGIHTDYTIEVTDCKFVNNSVNNR